MQGFLVLAGIIASLIYGVASIWAAYLGLHLWLGGWGIIIVLVCLFFRFSLPLSVGAFLGAMYVWDWHWALAALFAAPGLALMIPAVFTGLVSALPGRRRVS